MMMNRYLLLCFFFLLSETVESQVAYETEITSWKKERLLELKSEKGWLNLAGLFWLNEGKQSFGGNATDKIQFPIPSFPASVGYYEKEGNIVRQIIEKEVDLRTDNIFRKEAVVFHADSIYQPLISFASFRWSLIQREDRVGIRFRDLNHPAINELKEIPCFPIDTLFRVTAKLVRPIVQTKIPIVNVLGQTTMQVSPGKLYFTLNQQTYMLDALLEDDKLFIIFGDATSGQTTYPAGRFLYAKMPGEDGMTIVDFNKAFNPPCAFTPYATCPLPPRQNILTIAVLAGEKKAGNH